MSELSRQPTLSPVPPPRRRRPSKALLVTGAAILALVALPFVKRLDSGDDRAVTNPPVRPVDPTAAERRWLAGIADWVAWVESAIDSPSPRIILACGEELDQRAGPPPASRVRPFAEIASNACAVLERGLRDRVQSEVNQDAELLEQGHEAVGEGRRLVGLLKQPGSATIDRPSAQVPALARVASTLAGNPVSVWCWSESGWSQISESLRHELGEHVIGLAGFSDQRIDLAPDVCDVLRSIARTSSATEEEALAVAVLGHEIAHLRGRDNEAAAECEGMQLMRPVAAALGVERRRAGALAETFWGTLYREQPAPYVTERCRDGGPLDLRPRSSVWP